MIDNFDFHVSRVLEGPLSDYELGAGALIYGHFEERSSHFDPSAAEFSGVNFYQILENDSDDTLRISGFGDFPKANLGKLRNFVDTISEQHIYLDVTGLTHSVWAPLTKLILAAQRKLSVIYVEPRDYKKSDNPAGGLIYDLSDKTEGIAPIPGFASFPGDDEDNYIFAAFLGFEGPRFFHALEQLEPRSDTVFPIIGVPGYRPEYPFYSFEGNQIPLKLTKYQAWKNIRYASASCPFSAFRTLKALKTEYPNKRIKIGLFGTKPHALGAIMFRLSNPNIVELIYDHPVRKVKRTSGAMAKHIFDVSDYMANCSEFQHAMSKGRLR